MYKYKGIKWVANLETDPARVAESLLPVGAHILIPKETSKYTIDELTKMGYSGLYLKEDLAPDSLALFWIAYKKALQYYQIAILSRSEGENE